MILNLKGNKAKKKIKTVSLIKNYFLIINKNSCKIPINMYINWLILERDNNQKRDYCMNNLSVFCEVILVYFKISLPITNFCISDVPSPMVQSFESR